MQRDETTPTDATPSITDRIAEPADAPLPLRSADANELLELIASGHDPSNLADLIAHSQLRRDAA